MGDAVDAEHDEPRLLRQARDRMDREYAEPLDVMTVCQRPVSDPLRVRSNAASWRASLANEVRFS